MSSRQSGVRWQTFPVSCALLLLAALATGQPASDFRIIEVIPPSAAAGETIALILTRQVNSPNVEFDSSHGVHSARILRIVKNVVYVEVPPRLAEEKQTTIRVTEQDGGEAYYRAYRVTARVTEPQALNIRSIEPSAAEPGDTIKIVLTRPLNDPAAARLYLPTGTVPITPTQKGSEVTARLPNGLKEGDVFLVLQESALSSTSPYRFKILEETYFGIKRTWFFFILVAIVASAIAVVNYWRERKARLQKREKELELLRTFNAAAPSGERIPTAVPDVPVDLVKACASERCILFAGPGLGAQAGLHTRYQSVARLVEDLIPDAALKSQLNDALRNGQVGFVTDVLTRRIPRDMIINALRTLYADVDLSGAHVALRRLPFASVLTTAWDGLVEKAFKRRDPEVVTTDTEFEGLRTDRFFIVRLNGDLFEEASFIFSSKEYRQALSTRPSYARFISSQISGHSLFFAGMSLTGIEEFFDAFPSRVSIDRSYAIIPYTTLWEEQRERVREEYGVELIGYPYDENHTELANFLGKLEQAVGRLETTTASEISDGKLRSVQLKNIGAFADLTINEFQPGWNVLLGNNGSGKSTILRAIALALCGDDPEAELAAAPLLREKALSGRIEVKIGNVTYRTDLYRDGDRVKIDADQSPLRSGSWVALGFPPLRGVSTRDPSGASPLAPPAPGVRDLLPLIRGTIDTRLDSLKQWLVNLDIFSTPGGNITKEDAKRYARTNDAFYGLLKHFMPGQPVEKAPVDRIKFKVYVKTQDPDPVPIERLSQGMSSIFGWIGTLIQRIFEIYPNAEPPKNDEEGIQQSALVLVDEIDAHLHPEWQRKLRSIVTKYLPNVQVVASTHSPLLVAGMKQAELLIARRSPRQPSVIDVFPSPIDPQGLRADQVLTSPLFGLDSARSPDVDEKIDKYVKLLAKSDRNETDERDFLELKRELGTILLAGETEPERVAEQRAAATSEKRVVEMTVAIANSSDEMKERFRNEL